MSLHYADIAPSRQQRQRPLLGMRRTDAAECVGGTAVLDRLISEHGLKIKKGKGRGAPDLVDFNELQAAWRRFFDGEGGSCG